uniref:Ground-like domain-containing protein n=1 Tax=Steinernema glaseri TaxID=37863 RepID=A0A1I7YGD6_9BILA
MSDRVKHAIDLCGRLSSSTRLMIGVCAFSISTRFIMLGFLLVAMNCVLLAQAKCYGRDSKDGMCARIKPNQFQIQGVQIVDASEKIHEDIEKGQYQPSSNIRRQAVNYQDEIQNFPQAGGGTVGQIEQPTGQQPSGVGFVPQTAPSLGGEQREVYGAAEGSVASQGTDYAPPARGRPAKKGKKQPPGIAPSGAQSLTQLASTGFISNAKDPYNIREGKQGALSSAIVGKYYYPPKQDLPLPKCFHNPTGYVCCNTKLNAIMENAYKELRKNPKFNTCNVGVIATTVQKTAEKEFSTPFESIAALEDFAQKVHFSGDMVCKIEIDGKYILAYATPYHADKAVDPEVLAGRKKIEGEGEARTGELLGPRRVRSMLI